MAGIEEKMMTLFYCIWTMIFGFVVGYIKGWQLALIVSILMPFMGYISVLYAKVISTITSKKLSVYEKAGAVAA